MSLALFMDGDLGEQTGKIITFIVTMVAMTAGFYLIPLLPSPLPIIIAFLVAYAVYNGRIYGALAGSIIISLGLVYHLSRIGFFQIFQGPLEKTIILALIMAPFIICPVIANNNLQIIAMNMGIIAVCLLFFRETFYLAIPLILVFATIYKGKGIAFTFVYYAFLSLPLQVIQYLKTFELGIPPPLYTSLDLVYTDIQSALITIDYSELAGMFALIGSIFLTRGFVKGIEAPDYMVSEIVNFMKSEGFLEYLNRFRFDPTTYTPSVPVSVLDSFMEFVKEAIPTYGQSKIGIYVNNTLPSFITEEFSSLTLNSIETSGDAFIQAQIIPKVTLSFPKYVNKVFSAYFLAAGKQYFNSVPGMIIFLIVMTGLISFIAFINMKMPDPVQKPNLPGRYVNILIYILPVVAAAITNLTFFTALNILHEPLNFLATVNQNIFIGSTAFTILFSTPVAFSKYILDLNEVRTSRTGALTEESAKKLEQVRYYINIIESLNDHLPDHLIELKTRMLIVEDEIKEIQENVEKNSLELRDLDNYIRRIYRDLDEEIKNFYLRLDASLEDYYIRIKFEYLESVSEILDLGLDVEPPELPEYSSNFGLEEKVEHIKGVLDAGKVLVEKLIDTSDKIYEIISSLFEPTLPKDSATIQISREKLEEDEPWVIIKAILVSLKNWEKQYATDIINATKPINDSVETIIQLSRRKSSLEPLLGEKFEMIKDLSQRVTARNLTSEDDNLKVLKVILIRDTILSTVDVVGRIIGLLYYHLQDLEFNINLLLPRADYEWNRNLTLTERMNQSLEVINNYENYGINEIVTHLYRVLSYIDEAVDTIEYYNERREMLLNWKVMEKKISRIIKRKDGVTLNELGVAEKYGLEYLKMYHRTTPSPLILEESNQSLRRNLDA